MQNLARKLKRSIAMLLAVIMTLFGVLITPVSAGGYSYNDGKYTGSGTGRNGSLSVEVTVKNGAITTIEVGDNNETASYLEKAKGVIDDIIAEQSTEVNTISGATISSRAIIEAVGSALAQAYSSIFDSGYGTEKFPFIIDDLTQLQAFRDSVNQGDAYTGQYIALSRNIDISGSEWTPIDNFSGTFDGGGYVISGLTIGSSGAEADCQNAGLFAALGSAAVVKNLGVTEVEIYIKNASASTYAGGLAAKTNSGTKAEGGTIIDNCYVTGTMVSSETTSSKLSYAGGLVASLGQYSSITNCWTDIPAKSEAGGTMSAYAGGLTSLTGNNVTVVNCYTLGEVTGTSRNLSNGAVAGGLFGMQGGKSYNCYSLSAVTANNIKADGSYQTTTNILVGALAGQVPGNGTMDMVCYSKDAIVTVNEAVYSPVPAVGKGASNTEPTNVHSFDAEEMVSEALVEALNYGLKTLNRVELSIPGSVSLYEWELSDSAVTLSDKVYGDDEVDSGIFAGGKGTAAEPYIVQTEKQLRDFAVSLNEKLEYAGIYIRLDKDIDISSSDWNPIGQGEDAFRGTFDGAGHKIKGLTYGSPENAKDATNDVYVALFGVIGQNGLVRNLGLDNVGIYTTGQHSVNSAAIAGYLEGGGIDNCYATGTITGKTTKQGNNFVGGLVANQYKGYIINSWADVDVRSETVGTHVSEAGGLVSLNNRGLIANCYTLGDASGDAVRAAEGMAYVSNLVACQAGTIVNCYVLGNTVSDSYSFYVGAISGMTTGIGKGYLSYYNKKAVQMIENQVPDPFVAVGTTISTVEDGVVTSGFNYGLRGYEPAEMKRDSFATVLNGNFEAFPVKLSDWLPTGTTLKTWTYDSGKNLVVLDDTDAAINYVPVVVNDETSAAYKAGTYYGRDNKNKETIVKVTVTEDKITAIEVISHNWGDNFDPEATIDAVLLAQSTDIEYDTSSQALTAMLGAIDAALERAKVGDTTGYGKVNPGIFAGGTGRKADPYKIATAKQLADFAASINADEEYEGNYVALSANISLKGLKWVPSGSGNAAYAFKGIFSGGGYTISDMTIGSEMEPSDYQYVGLFGYLNRAAVNNVKLTNVNIYNHYTGTGRSYAGVLAGAMENATDIDRCTAKGVLFNHAKNQCYTGGLISFTSSADGAEGYITNCSTDVDITGISDTAWVYLGGISGLNNRTYIINCYTLGDAIADSTINVNKAAIGGIAGFQAGYVRNCYTLGNMKSVLSSTDVGGYAGRHTGIATTYYSYYNSGASHYSGNTLLAPAPGVGVYVPSSSTGLVTAVNVEGKVEANMRSAEFSSLLNQNMTNVNVSGVLTDGIVLKPWVYNKALNQVVLAEDSTGSDNGSDDDDDSDGGSGGTRNGGSSSGTSNPAAPVTTPTNTAPAGNGTASVTSTTTAEVKTDANGNARATVTVGQIAEAVNKAVEAAAQAGKGVAVNIEIKVLAPSNATTIETSIPEAAVDTMAHGNNTGLTVSTPIASIAFDGSSLATIAQAASGEVNITASIVDAVELSAEAQQVVGGRPVFNFSVTSGNTVISQFGGNVTVSVPYTPRPGEDTGAIVIYYINAEGKPELVSNCLYDPATGSISFKTNHFSKYAVGYNKVAFTDVPANSAYGKAVTFVAARGITTGTGAGKFSPEEKLTRGQFCVMVMKAYGIKPEASGKDNFADAGNTYYTGYLAAAKRLGLANGIGNNKYAPDREITRQEMLVLLHKILKSIDKLPKGENGKELTAYTDANQIATWAKEAMALFVKAGIITGSDNKLTPEEAVNRAQLAQVLYKLLAE